MTELTHGSTSQVVATFAPPSMAEVQHSMRDLEYGERLVVHRMTVGLGSTVVDVYSFAELLANIFGSQWDRLQLEASKANLVWVDPLKLTDWLRDVIGDVELATAVAGALEGADSYKAQVEAVFPLFKERAAQYEAVLSADGSTN